MRREREEEAKSIKRTHVKPESTQQKFLSYIGMRSCGRETKPRLQNGEVQGRGWVRDVGRNSRYRVRFVRFLWDLTDILSLLFFCFVLFLSLLLFD